MINPALITAELIGSNELIFNIIFILDLICYNQSHSPNDHYSNPDAGLQVPACQLK